MSFPIAPQLDFSEIPVIDLAQLLTNSNNTATISQIADACERVGFFYVSNHGVDKGIISELQKQATLFFKQSIEDKERLLVNYQMRGYLPLNYQSFKAEKHKSTSHQEGFWIGHETPQTKERPLDGPNHWPDDLPAFRQAMEHYFAAVESLATVLIHGFAHALNIAPDALLALFKSPTTRLKLNHYPPQNNPIDEHNIGVISHADSGGFTILWQDDNGGLEVQNKKGEWVGAPPIADTFVVNLGSIMQILSAGRFSSTQHRVINRGGSDRYSIPLFVNPNQSAIIQPLCGDDRSLGDGIVYGEYQAAYWQKAFPKYTMQ